jgi:hypothetical protein
MQWRTSHIQNCCWWEEEHPHRSFASTFLHQRHVSTSLPQTPRCACHPHLSAWASTTRSTGGHLQELCCAIQTHFSHQATTTHSFVQRRTQVRSPPLQQHYTVHALPAHSLRVPTSCRSAPCPGSTVGYLGVARQYVHKPHSYPHFTHSLTCGVPSTSQVLCARCRTTSRVKRPFPPFQTPPRRPPRLHKPLQATQLPTFHPFPHMPASPPLSPIIPLSRPRIQIPAPLPLRSPLAGWWDGGFGVVHTSYALRSMGLLSHYPGKHSPVLFSLMLLTHCCLGLALSGSARVERPPGVHPSSIVTLHSPYIAVLELPRRPT